MATAKIETIAKKVVQEVEEETFVLTLSRDEAETLYALTGVIMGGSLSYARHTNAIRGALAFSGLCRGRVAPAFRSRFKVSEVDGTIRALLIEK